MQKIEVPPIEWEEGPYTLTENTIIEKRQDGSYVLDGIFHVALTNEFSKLITRIEKAIAERPERLVAIPEPTITKEQLFAGLRFIREDRLAEYDRAISQLERRLRLGYDVSSQIAAWDAYAISLCELPEQEGAPWDGGGTETPWPIKPE